MKLGITLLALVTFSSMPSSAEVIDKKGRILTPAQLKHLAVIDAKISAEYAAHVKPDKYHIESVISPDSDAPDYRIVEVQTGTVVAHLPKFVIPEVGSCFRQPTDEGLVMVQVVAPTKDAADSLPQNVKRGIFDLKTGRMLNLPPTFNAVFPFSCGLAPFEIIAPGSQGNQLILKYGYLNKTGEIAIKPEFDDYLPFENNLAPVLVANQWYYINTSGEKVITLPKDCTRAYRFNEGLAAVVFGGQKSSEHMGVGPRLGFINKSGAIVIKPRFYDHGSGTGFFNGLASVTNADPMHLQGYIDKSGKWVIPPQYYRAEQFINKDDTARVEFKVRSFDKAKWLSGGDRYDLFNALLVQYGLLNTKRDRVYELLGKPDKINGPDDDEYAIISGHMGYLSVRIRYKNAVVLKYQMNYMKPEDWYDAAHPNTGDSYL